MIIYIDKLCPFYMSPVSSSTTLWIQLSMVFDTVILGQAILLIVEVGPEAYWSLELK